VTSRHQPSFVPSLTLARPRARTPQAVPSPPAELAALSCRRLVAWYTQRASGNPLLKDLPAALVSAFTLGGRMRLERFIVDDTNGGKGSHYKHPRAHMEAAMAKARAQLKAARDAADSLGMDTTAPLLLQPAGSAGDGPLQLGAHVSAVAAASASAETLKMLRVQDRAYVAALATLLEVEGKHALVFGSVEVRLRPAARDEGTWRAWILGLSCMGGK